jgi:hypothetical protein
MRCSRPTVKTVLVSDDGRYDQYIQVASARTGAVRQTIRYRWAGQTKNPSRGVVVGLAYSSDGRKAYASGGGQNVIHVFRVLRNGLLINEPDIAVARPPADPFLAGLTATNESHLLIVAEELRIELRSSTLSPNASSPRWRLARTLMAY